MRALLVKMFCGFALALCMGHSVVWAAATNDIDQRVVGSVSEESAPQEWLVLEELASEIAPRYFTNHRRRLAPFQWSAVKTAGVAISSAIEKPTTQRYKQHIGFCPVKAGEAGFLFRYTPF